MEEFHISLASLISFIVITWFITTLLLKPSRDHGRKLPPSPWKLPMIGNLHQLSSLPHRSLHFLAKKHGDLMLLHFGNIPVLVVSSAHYAREIMKTHDLIFASRPPFKAYKNLLYDFKDMATAPYGEYWRKMKSIVVLQLLCSKRVRSFRGIREEEVRVLMKKIEDCRGQVDLNVLFAEFSSDVVGRAAFGRRYSESENGKKFLRVMKDLMELLGMINIGDFIPWLGWTSWVNGFDRRLDRTAKEMDEVLESVIRERLEATEDELIGENFMDILLKIYKENDAEVSIDRDSLKALILDVFIGGTYTISTTLEWVMSELLRHPDVLEKIQREVRGIVKRNHNITDDDLEKVHYLKAMLKETLRYHPPDPLLVPRISRKDVQMNGFDISVGTVVMINAWAIARDPNSWDAPEKFMPERFLNSSVDFKGQDFEFIPFGAGRRGCPGMTFAVVAIEFVLANLIQKFDWKLGDGIEGKDLNMNEKYGLVVCRDVPLLAVASQCV